MEIITHSRCNHCMTVKPLSAFNVRHDRGGRPASNCKACKATIDRARHRAKRTGVITPKVDQGWPIPAEADLTVQLLNLHTRRAYGAVPGVLMGRL